MVPSSMTKEQTMSPLRARMIEDMKLAGLAATTQEIYLQAVRSLAKHYNRSPELLAEEEVRRYLLDVRERNARGSFKTSHYGIQFFYRNTLGEDWALFKKRSGFPSRGAAHSRRGPQSDTPRLFQPDLRLRPADQRGRCSSRHRHRQDQWRPARRRQGQQGTGRARAQGGARRPAADVAGQEPPRSALALPQWLANRSRRHPCPDPHLCRGRQGGQF